MNIILTSQIYIYSDIWGPLPYILLNILNIAPLCQMFYDITDYLWSWHVLSYLASITGLNFSKFLHSNISLGVQDFIAYIRNSREVKGVWESDDPHAVYKNHTIPNYKVVQKLSRWDFRKLEVSFTITWITSSVDSVTY